jgi:16S rRNA G966 N2-methylase RsmD
MWEKALELVDEDIRWLSEDGWVIVQIDPREYKKVSLEKLEEFEHRKYGSTMLIFYERKLEPETPE